MEKNYDFRSRHWMVHVPNRRRKNRVLATTEVLMDETWQIGGSGGTVLEYALQDYQDYLWRSMGISVRRCSEPGKHSLWFQIDETINKGFVICACEEGITVSLARDTESFRACVHLEDIMNLEGAPVIPKGRTVRRPLYDHRSVHSGSGLDDFPDQELLALVHAGYDTIEVYIKGIDETRGGHRDINDIIQRAKRYGIGVMLKNSITAFIHPDDANAAEVFDQTYGELFRRYPDALGISFTGEATEFPSKDPHTTGKLYSESVVDGILDTRPSPGWYPCEDYPAYLTGVKNAICAVKPDALVIFSTYNIAYQPAQLRRKLLEKLPEEFSLMVSFENTSCRTLEGLRTPVKDYTISADRPSTYFESECAACHELNIPVWGNVNTAGIAWDFGCVPYVPAPRKLLNRMRYLRQARDRWDVRSHYTTHHYGWTNCYAADLGKWAAWEDYEPDYDVLLRKIAVRDYGADAADHVLKAWEYWSQAMDYYIASNEDQYGPWRVGAAYPFIFQPNITRTMLGKEIQFPTAPHAYFGHKIIKTLYQPYEYWDQAPGFLRHPADLRALTKMEALWIQGLEEAKQAGSSENAARLVALGQFILCSVRTVINIKNWWIENMRLQLSANQKEALARLDVIEAIAQKEIQNVHDCIPAVEADSRIGWEPSMEYVADRWHLEWKLRQMESALREVSIYRSIVENAYADTP